MRRTRVRELVTILSALVVLAGCSSLTLGPRPGVPETDVKELAAALEAGSLDEIPLVDADGAQEDLSAALGTMNALPTVTPGSVEISSDSTGYIATAQLTVEWALPGDPWSYATEAVLEHSDEDEWKTRWSPAMLHPDLTADTRLVRTQALGDRGAITDRNGDAITGLASGYRIGIDKTLIDADQWKTSARLLAKVLDLNADAYAKKVAAYGERAWVPAANVAGASAPSGVYDVPGVTVTRTKVYTSAPGRSSTFAQPLVGTTGEASAEVVDESEGALQAGDIVGVSGLQLLYDEQLRGTAGVTIAIGARTSTGTTDSSATPTTSTTASSASPSGTPEEIVLERDAIAGKALQISIDSAAQAQAEKVLASSKQSALVAVEPSTGQILAAATSTDSDLSIATQGRYPPGSTFKVVTTLALLRQGLTEQSTVTCPSSTSVDGRTISNYSDYPSDKLGSITLRTAFAESCNTAFVSSYDKIDESSLADAGGSLGLGIDYEPGYYSYWGSIPSPTDPVARAEAMIGQGEDLASPLAMSSVAASVSAGKTVIPSLIPGETIDPTGEELTETEAKALRSLMAAVVNEGSGTSLKGVVSGAKSGTAQYGSGTDLDTHAWMIAYKDTSLAVSAFVYNGESGTTTAGPLISSFVKAVS